MNIFLLILGLVLVLLALGDALWTALWVDGGAGPVTSFLEDKLWLVMRSLVHSQRDRLLSLAGPLIQTGVVITWVVLLWAGWTCIFSADDNALLYSRSTPPQRSDLTGRIYFVGYTLSTMGNGDYYPNGDSWEITTALTTLSGMFLITLVVSFLLSVIGGVNQKHALATQIMGLGHSSEEWVINTWDGNRFTSLDLQLLSLSTQLGKLTEQQLSYPVLHRYHGATAKKDSAPAIAVFDDALTLIHFGVRPDYRPAPATLRSARQSVESYLQTLASASIYPADRIPPPPDLGRLREAGIPVVSDEEFTQALESLTHRRRLLLGLVQRNSFRWPG